MVQFSSQTARRSLVSGVIAATLLAGVSACGSSEGGAEAASQQQMHTARVEVMRATPTRIESVRDLPGRATAYAEAEIRPQVTGIIESRHFTEGAQVEAGQELYTIDSAEYASAVESAKAALARAEATAATAAETAKRFKRLSDINAVSQQSYDEAVATQKQTEADIAIQKAALQRARIDLARTTVRAPISGQIGRSSVTPGALVTANQATALARIVQLDPIYVDLTASSSEMLKWKQDVAQGKVRTTGDTAAVPVNVHFENGTTYPETGRLEFSEVSVDQAAGTVIVRAQLPNPDGLLLPGMYVKGSFSAGALNDVYLVPQKAVQRTPRGEPTVLVVNAEGQAEQRMLTVQGTQDGDWIVISGLSEGDQVITSGFQSVRAGAPVDVIPSNTAAVTAMRDNPSEVAPE